MNDIVPLMGAVGVPTEAEKKEMARFRNIMEGNAPAGNVPAHVEGTYSQQQQNMYENYDYSAGQNYSQDYSNYDYSSDYSSDYGMGGMATEGDIKEMADILGRFHNATDNATERLVEESQTQPEIKRALLTEQTAHGLKIGEWEIRIRTEPKANGKTTKYYSVVQEGTETVLAKDLFLFEAADLLVKYFNEGKTLTDQDVREVLRLEEKFAKNWNDAVRYRRHSVKHLKEGDQHASDVFDARYDQAKGEAIGAKRKLKSLHESSI